MRNVPFITACRKTLRNVCFPTKDLSSFDSRLIILAAITALLSSCSDSENGNISAASEAYILQNSGTSVSESLTEISHMPSNNSQTAEPRAEREENGLNITITVNGYAFSATLYDNQTARSFKERLPLTLNMSELNSNEKYCYLPEALPKNSSNPSAIRAGDIMLYGGDCLVIFYKSFSTSYSYTPIGKIHDTDGLSAALGSGDVRVVFD